LRTLARLYYHFSRREHQTAALVKNNKIALYGCPTAEINYTDKTDKQEIALKRAAV
jgi:hypothetical protein